MRKRSINKQKIIDVTVDLISKKGVNGTTLADIAKAADISKGTLYYHYASKNDLIFAITETHMDHLTNSLFDIIRKNRGDVTWRQMMGKLFTTVIGSETRTRLHIYLIQEILTGNSQLKIYFTETYNKWFSMISEAYRLITDNEKDISLEARIFVSAVDGFIIQHIIGLDEIPFDDVVNKLSTIIGE